MTQNLVLHVRENGDDALDGLTRRTAKATLGGALQALKLYDPGWYAVEIRLGPGRFHWPLVHREGYFANNLRIAGEGTDRTYITGKSVVPGSCALADLCFTHTTVTVRRKDSVCFSLDEHRTRVRLDSSTLRVAGQLNLTDSELEITGSMPVVLHATPGGRIECDATVFRAVGEPVFELFAQPDRGAAIIWGDSTFSGAARGGRGRRKSNEVNPFADVVPPE